MIRTALLLALFACSSAPSRERTIANASHAPLVDDTDAIVEIVLAKFAADPRSLSDAGLLPATGPILVCAEIGDPSHRVVSRTSLPHSARPLVITPLAEIQRQADRTNQPVAFIRFYDVDVYDAGTRASVSAGVDLVLPAQSHAIKTCCCSSSARWDKRAGRWTEGDTRLVICG